MRHLMLLLYSGNIYIYTYIYTVCYRGDELVCSEMELKFTYVLSADFKMLICSHNFTKSQYMNPIELKLINFVFAPSFKLILQGIKKIYGVFLCLFVHFMFV